MKVPCLHVLFLMALLSLTTGISPLKAQVTQQEWDDATCPNAEIWGANLINGICWNAMFPLQVLGATIGDGPVPPDADHDVVCTCQDENGFPQVGLGAGYWSPARLTDVVRKPYCSPSLGGISIMRAFQLYAGYKSLENDNSDKTFFHYNYYSFPLFVILNILRTPGCESDGYLDFDLIFTSPHNPVWNDDELALIMVAEAILFANPLAQAACMTSCVAASAGILEDRFFWCAGCWGSLYPFTGNVLSASSMPRVTALIALRALASFFRMGFERKTVGDQAQCGGTYHATIPKSQFRMSHSFPLPQADPDLPLGCANPIGASTLVSGNESRNIPSKEDYVHMQWRYTDCCVR